MWSRKHRAWGKEHGAEGEKLSAQSIEQRAKGERIARNRWMELSLPACYLILKGVVKENLLRIPGVMDAYPALLHVIGVSGDYREFVGNSCCRN